MDIFKTKLHRKVEKAMMLKNNALKQPFEDLQKRHGYSKKQIMDAVKGGMEYCKENNSNDSESFLVAFNFYVSCLNNPKKK